MNIEKDIWIFAYGSLMWRPGFDYEQECGACLQGYHRDMCILSYVFRGTPQIPGLVLGLNPGGACKGRAFRVAASKRESVLRYLDERELINHVYRPVWVEIDLENGERVKAYSFVAVSDHEQYVGHLPDQNKVAFIRQGVGSAGTSRAYLDSTCRHLRDLGIEDVMLERLLAMVCASDG